ncbi:MAG: tetratricopeptide repeat protein [Syntrophales bacterium]
MADDALRERDAFREGTEAFLAADDEVTALAVAETRLLRMPGDLDAQGVICRIRIRQGRLEEAEAILHDMEGSLASLSRVYAALWDAYRSRGLEEKEEAAYRKYKALNPDVAPAPEEAGRPDDGLPGPMAEPEREAEPAAEVPADFQTVTLAELYIRQGHLGAAEELLEAIAGREPDNARAAQLLGEVRETVRRRQEAERQNRVVIGELSRWLDNAARLRGHAG